MNILFVCSGNVFRSMSADYCLKYYLKQKGIEGVNVSSAGTHYRDDTPDPRAIDELKGFGIDASMHERRDVTKEILEEADLVVAMAGYHQVFLKESLGFDSILFNEVCYGVKKSIDDNWEMVDDYHNHEDNNERYIRGIIDYIHDSIPKFVENMNNFTKSSI